MKKQDLYKYLPEKYLENITFENLLPCQEKAINKGLFDNKNLLICSPTGSGKTFVSELGILNTYLNSKKSLYLAPLRALATEKAKVLKTRYPFLEIGLSIGDYDLGDSSLKYKDVIITTSEKFDSLLRHKLSFLNQIECVVVDEIHLLDDVNRGPVLEIIITLLKGLKPQIIALSATIKNKEELANWLDANLVYDEFRPIKLLEGIYMNNEIIFMKESE